MPALCPPWRGARQPRPVSERELCVRAAALTGQSVGAIAAALGHSLPPPGAAHKGFVGQLLEAALGADADAGERPDFLALGIELKTVPVAEQAGPQGPQLVPQESTFVCSIAASAAPDLAWATSRLHQRLGAVLLVPVTAAPLAPLAERRVYAPRLWRPSATQWQQLRADWEDLQGAIAAGRGPELTAREGVALQVRPKAAHSRVRVLGAVPGGVGPVPPQGFYLRARFLAEVLAGA